jgi:hypothetical protein
MTMGLFDQMHVGDRVYLVDQVEAPPDAMGVKDFEDALNAGKLSVGTKVVYVTVIEVLEVQKKFVTKPLSSNKDEAGTGSTSRPVRAAIDPDPSAEKQKPADGLHFKVNGGAADAVV